MRYGDTESSALVTLAEVLKDIRGRMRALSTALRERLASLRAHAKEQRAALVLSQRVRRRAEAERLRALDKAERAELREQHQSERQRARDEAKGERAKLAAMAARKREERRGMAELLRAQRRRRAQMVGWEEARAAALRAIADGIPKHQAAAGVNMTAAGEWVNRDGVRIYAREGKGKRADAMGDRLAEAWWQWVHEHAEEVVTPGEAKVTADLKRLERALRGIKTRDPQEWQEEAARLEREIIGGEKGPIHARAGILDKKAHARKAGTKSQKATIAAVSATRAEHAARVPLGAPAAKIWSKKDIATVATVIALAGRGLTQGQISELMAKPTAGSGLARRFEDDAEGFAARVRPDGTLPDFYAKQAARYAEIARKLRAHGVPSGALPNAEQHVPF